MQVLKTLFLSRLQKLHFPKNVILDLKVYMKKLMKQLNYLSNFDNINDEIVPLVAH